MSTPSESTAPVSIFGKVTKADIRLDPFPYLVVENALPEDYYAQLAELYPSLQQVAGSDEFPNNTLFLRDAIDVIGAPDIHEIWQRFFKYHCSRQFFDDVLDVWEETVEKLYPNIETQFGKPIREFEIGRRLLNREDNAENWAPDITLDSQFGINSPVTEVSSVRGAHVDRRYKLFAALLYFRLPDDTTEGGELILYRYKDKDLQFSPDHPISDQFMRNAPARNLSKIDESDLIEHSRIPYAPNTLICWINTPYSIHGVSPRHETEKVRRYVNFLGESFDKSKEGFFTNHKPVHKFVGRLKERLLASFS